VARIFENRINPGFPSKTPWEQRNGTKTSYLKTTISW